MKKYKFSFGSTCELSDEPAIADSYALNGNLIDSPPHKAKLLGYAYLEDGSCVECYKKSNPLPFIVPLCIVLVALVGIVLYILFGKGQNIAIGEAILKINSGDSTIVFNGIPSYSNGSIDLRFVNGNEPMTVTIEGEGIECSPITLTPQQELYDFPLTIVSDDDVIVATLKCTTDTSEASYEIILEVPENMNDYTDGISGYFNGEVIIDE